jgi:hypothetical protein
MPVLRAEHDLRRQRMRSDAEIQQEAVVVEPEVIPEETGGLKKGRYVVVVNEVRDDTWLLVSSSGHASLKEARVFARENGEPGTEVAILRVADVRKVGAHVIRSLK